MLRSRLPRPSVCLIRQEDRLDRRMWNHLKKHSTPLIDCPISAATEKEILSLFPPGPPHPAVLFSFSTPATTRPSLSLPLALALCSHHEQLLVEITCHMRTTKGESEAQQSFSFSSLVFLFLLEGGAEKKRKKQTLEIILRGLQYNLTMSL